MNVFRRQSVFLSVLSSALLLGVSSAQSTGPAQTPAPMQTPAPAPSTLPPLTLAAALAGADQAPTALAAARALQQARDALRVAEAQAGPSLGFTAQGGAEWPQTGSFSGTGLAQLGASVPLGSSSVPALAVRQARLALRTEEANWRQTRATLARQVESAFGAVLQAAQQQQLAGTRLTLAAEQLRAAQSRTDLGAAPPGDLLAAQLAVTLAQQAQRQADAAQRDAQLNLARQLGLAALSGMPVLSVIPTPPPLPGPTLAAAIQNSPAVVLAQLQVEQATLTSERSVLAGRPALSVGLNYTGDHLVVGSSYAFPTGVLQGTLGYQVGSLGSQSSALTTSPGVRLNLAANIPIYDGGAQATGRSSAARDLAAARTALGAAQRDVGSQVQVFVNLATLDQQDITTQRAALDAAQRTLAEAQQRLQAGTVTPLEVLVAEVQVSAAEGAVLAAQLRLQDDTYQLGALLGLGDTP